MNFDHSEKTQELLDRVRAFMAEHVEPNEMVYYEQLDSGETRWQTPPIMEDLKVKAKAEATAHVIHFFYNIHKTLY